MMDTRNLNAGRARATRRLDEADVDRASATRRLDEEDSFFTTEDEGSPLVMVIDDSPAVRRVVEMSLQRAGISAVSFPDGLQAIAALKNGEIAPPRVLLLDIGLPKMNGYDLARLFRGNPALNDMQIIMLSGRDGVVNRAYSRMLGASDFIAKPFKSHALVKRIRLALGLAWPHD
jgi:DNA-binding response OmpR family regulator